MFWRFSGTSRWAWNESLGYHNQRYKDDKQSTSLQDYQKHIQDLKHNNPDYAWLNDVPEAITKQSVKDLIKAFKMKHEAGFGAPRFKKRGKCDVGFYQRTDNFHQVDDTHIKITGIKKPVKIKKCDIPSHVMNTRVTYDNKYWYLSYSYEVDVKATISYTDGIGVDLGIKDLAIVSDGRVYGNINKTHEVRRLEKYKRRLQRQLSKKYELNKQGNKFVKTSNIKKLEQKIRLIDRRLANIRNTYLHEVTKSLVRTKPESITIEDLNVRGMMKNRHLARAIAQEEFNKFRRYLTYKCELYGIKLVVADRWYPSSKMCSSCGCIMKGLKLSDRTYKCPDCGLVIDRDLNAAINLRAYGCA